MLAIQNLGDQQGRLRFEAFDYVEWTLSECIANNILFGYLAIARLSYR